MACAGSRFCRVPCTVAPIWCIFVRPAHPWAIAVTPATRSAAVFTSLWQLAYGAPCFHVTLSESGLVGAGGRAPLSMSAALGTTGFAEVSALPPPQARTEPTTRASAARDSGEKEAFRMAGATLLLVASLVLVAFVLVVLVPLVLVSLVRSAPRELAA